MTSLSFNHSYVFDPIWSQLQEFIWCVCLLCRINFYLTFAAQLPHYVTAFKAFKEPSEMSSKGLVSLDKNLPWNTFNLAKLWATNPKFWRYQFFVTNLLQIYFCCKINSFTIFSLSPSESKTSSTKRNEKKKWNSDWLLKYDERAICFDFEENKT